MSAGDTGAPLARLRSGPGRARLWAEFAALFLGVPVLMAVYFGQYPLFPVLMGLTLVAAALLTVTPGFRWAELARLPDRRELWLAAGFAALTALACLAIAAWLVPHRLLDLPRHRTGLWLMILALYPVLSAAPQELIYRPLFFRRYGALFPGEGMAVAANAAVFGFGHLFYMNPVTIAMTAAGGAFFAVAYLRQRCFLLAVLLHALAGQLVFTAGLGQYFYHGAVGR